MQSIRRADGAIYVCEFVELFVPPSESHFKDGKTLSGDQASMRYLAERLFGKIVIALVGLETDGRTKQIKPKTNPNRKPTKTKINPQKIIK